MSDEARLAKAEAKAAKAKAKGLRPFYKKKRWWALAALVVIVIAVSTGGGSKEETSNSDDSSSSGVTENTISTGLGSKDATDDVNSLDCGTPDSLGFINPTVNVTNNSSKSSTYFITVTAESADGATKYDDTVIMITSLAPGQTMTEEGMFLNDIPTGAVCKITEVQRTAS
jgi:hypothetical protein